MCRISFAIVPAALLLFTGGAWAQISLVHATSCGAGTFPGTICTIPATGSGNLIVVGWQTGSGANTATTLLSVTDNAGNAYFEAGAARAVDTAAGSVADIWYARNSVAGATSITITPSASVSNGGAVVWEFSGVDTTAPLDQVAMLNSQPSTATPVGAAVTTTAASEAVISLAAVSGGVTGISPGNPFTSAFTLNQDGWAHLIAPSGGTYAAQWNQSPAGTYASSTVSFRAAGLGGACDVSRDGTVDILDAQVATNMNLGLTPCTAPSGFCTEAFVQREISSALGQGCSLPVLAASPASIDFGSVVVGGSGSQAATLTVTGVGSTTISQATVSGTGVSISGLTLPLSLAVGQSANFAVTFAPPATGTMTGNLVLTSDALDSPVNIALSGTGVTSSPSPHSVSLSWTASTSPNIAGYNVYRGTVSGGPYAKVNSSLVPGTTYSDTNVSAGQTYYYVATAVDSNNNESAYSNQAPATIPTP
jgi:hypothetical protein